MYPELILRLGKNIYVFKTYNVFLVLSICIGSLLSYISLRKNIKYSFILIIGLVVNFVVCARLLNYLVNHKLYKTTDLSVFSLRPVGFSFYGGVLGSIILLVLIGSMSKISIWALADKMILPLGVSFFVMRIGCFLNGCCFGKFTTCFLGVPLSNAAYTSTFKIFTDTLKVHPTQLYEGFAALVGVIVFCVYKKKINIKGLLTIYYGIYLSVIRWIVLYFRQFNYSEWVVYYFYPLLYAVLIIIGLVMVKRLKIR